MEEKEKGRRGFLGRLLVFLLTLLALLGLVAMALSVINGFINPQNFIWTTIFGLAFWEIFVFNVVVFLLLLLLWSRRAWIAVLALLIAIPGLKRSYSFGKKVEATTSVRIMSYNVHNFDHIDGKTDKEGMARQVMEKVKEENPDILCCQEFSAFKQGVTRPKCIELFAESSGYSYVYYNKKRNYGGNVVFSKYPVEKVDEDSGFGQENTYGIMVSVQIA